MRIDRVLHTNVFSQSAMHQKRAGALSAAVCAVMHGVFLSVTALGRRLHSQAKTKHNIKRMDRLLSNPHAAFSVSRLALSPRSKRAKISSICSSVTMSGGHSATESPGMLRTKRPC